MELIFKNVWILFIVIIIVNVLILKSKCRKYIAENPALEPGYNKIFRTIMIYGNIPWIIIGVSILSGMTNSFSDFLRPRTLNPMVLFFHGLIILYWVLSFRWIYFKNGAEFLEQHPGIIQKRNVLVETGNVTAKEIRLFFPIMLLGGIIGMIMLWIVNIPAFK